MGSIAGFIGALVLVPASCAGKHLEHPYKRSDIDTPVSLAVGTVRTPEFNTVTQWYVIIIQVEKPLPLEQIICMMGVTHNPTEASSCSSNDPLLRADWIIWDKDQIVAKGSSTTKADSMFTKEHVYKFLGGFPGKSGKKYVLEVKFTQDGTPLNSANPHLIVIQQRYH
ncbi:MAG: hypothetical protein JWO13_3044 [Acidobacteriales bacterium]|nr:hypothetical protein [Terriglobales bacterium]